MIKAVNSSRKKDLVPVIMLAPAFILVVCVIIYPIFNAVITSFQYYKLTDLQNSSFVGFKNYIDIWHDDAFIASLANTFKWVGITVTTQFLFGLALAILLNQPFRGRSVIRSIILIPWVTPGVVIALMWSWIYNGNFGILNSILLKFGIIQDKIAWLANAKTALYSQIATMVWQGLPFFTIMILASFQTVPLDLYEAADISGANSFQKFVYITWPHILQTVITTLLLRVIWVFNNVEVLYVMSQGGPGYSSMTVSLNAYLKAQKSLNFGYGSTIAVFGTLCMIAFMIIYMKFTKKYRGSN